MFALYVVVRVILAVVPGAQHEFVDETPKEEIIKRYDATVKRKFLEKFNIFLIF